MLTQIFFPARVVSRANITSSNATNSTGGGASGRRLIDVARASDAAELHGRRRRQLEEQQRQERQAALAAVRQQHVSTRRQRFLQRAEERERRLAEASEPALNHPGNGGPSPAEEIGSLEAFLGFTPATSPSPHARRQLSSGPDASAVHIPAHADVPTQLAAVQPGWRQLDVTYARPADVLTSSWKTQTSFVALGSGAAPSSSQSPEVVQLVLVKEVDGKEYWRPVAMLNPGSTQQGATSTGTVSTATVRTTRRGRQQQQQQQRRGNGRRRLQGAGEQEGTPQVQVSLVPQAAARAAGPAAFLKLADGSRRTRQARAASGPEPQQQRPSFRAAPAERLRGWPDAFLEHVDRLAAPGAAADGIVEWDAIDDGADPAAGEQDESALVAAISRRLQAMEAGTAQPDVGAQRGRQQRRLASSRPGTQPATAEDQYAATLLAPIQVTSRLYASVP